MLRQRRLLLFTILTCFLQAQGADKYTDENRPYEFGFNIEGEQHRHEKKDEKGLVMGEFGFITADGVYHVTVYATDENGGFRILSMKNIRVKPYPTGPERQGHSLTLPSGPGQVPGPVAPSPNKPSVPGPVAPAPAKSCSHCSLPTTTTVRPPLSQPNYPPSSQPNYPPTNNYGNNPNYPGAGGNYPGSNAGGGGNNPAYPGSNGVNPNYPGPGGNNPNYPGSNAGPNYPQPGSNAQYPAPGQLPSGERNPKQFDPAGPTKPILDSAQISIVSKDTDIHAKKPGERDGLPNGLTKDDMMTLLYTFNYTVGFHGHFEEGYTNGAKQGYYFVTGRNGVRTRVDYVADEKGFRPKISQEVLDLLSDDVPKPETERDAKYGLKGYEFKWLYYPVESKGR